MKASNFISVTCSFVSAILSTQLLPMRKGLTLLMFSLLAFAAVAQPTVMSLNQDVSGTYANTTMTLVGAAYKLRVQENAVGTSSGTRNWQFNSDSYGNTWGARSANTLTSYNTVIAPNTGTASGNWANACSPGCYNAFGKLPATLANNYYTYTIMKGISYADQRMSVLETSYNPVTINTVAQAAGTNGSRTITITTSGAPDAAENIFVRFSTNSYVASNIVQATGSGTTWTATIPSQSAAVSFYVYSSNRSKAAIDADVTSFSTQEVHDLSTLNLNNNSGSNYSYFPVNVTSTGGTTSATYATLAAAITAINSGTHTGTIVCTVNDGYTETAPLGGFSITATGTVSNTITFTRSNSGGSRPIFTAPTPQTSGNLNDAIFKIIGGDYITIDGFEMRENAANTTTAAASNNMTEFGVALFYASTTNGAQNNTIQNNVITLNRTYQNTFGIYSNSTHSATAISSATATTTAGGNSGLKIYGNTISNVNQGIVVVGPTAAADMNTGIDIGGTGGVRANTISNFGTTGTFSGYANVSGTIYGVLVRNSIGYNVSFNSITSSAGGVTSGTLRGIYNPSASNTPTGTFTNNINSNIISLTYGVSTGTLQGITVEATTGTATSTQNINSNNFTALTASLATSATITAISDAMANLNTSISSNTFTNLSTNTTGSFNFITNAIAVPASGGTQTISSNSIVTAFNKTGAGGTVTFFSSNASSVTGSIINFQNNKLSNITVTGATGFTGINNTDGGSPTKTITGNKFDNISGGSGTMNPITVNFFGGSSSVSTDTITNISWGAAVTALTIGGSSSATTLNVNSNIINNIASTSGALIGISNTTPSTTLNMSSNIINTLSSTSAATNIGISYSGTAPTANIFKNKIYDISGNNAGTIINGIVISAGGTNNNIYNNLIGDLRATAATVTAPASAVIGINITSSSATTTKNVYYNTINLNATSSGANFGTTGIFHATSATATTAALNLRNNVIVNTSVANGTGLSVAFRRSAATLGNYATTSNRNDFFGTSGLYTDGTTTNTTLAAYKTLMSTRDQASINENPTWQNTTGSSADFLKYNTSVASGLESGGAGIGSSPFPAPFNDDYTGTIRFGSTGYVACTPKAGTDPDIGAWELCGIPLPNCTGTPAASTISGVTAVCTGFGTNLTLSPVYTDLGITYQWKSGTVPGGPYGTNLGTSSSQATGNLSANTYYICEITCSNSMMTYTTVEKSVLVNALPSVTVTPSAATYCTPGGTAVSITAIGGVTYAWSPAAGLNVTNVATVSASPAMTTTYTVTVTDANLCSSTGTAVITVAANPQNVTATATPASICSGSNSQLLATASLAASSASALDYTVSSGIALETITAPVVVTATTSGDTDDGYIQVTPSFTFSYLGTPITSYGVGTNGFIGLNGVSTSIPTSISFFAGSNVIYGFGRDGNLNTANSGNLTHGPASGGKYVFQMTKYSGGASGVASATIFATYQTVFWGASSAEPGRIDLIYGTSAGTPGSSGAIGIASADNTYRNAADGSTSPTALASAWPASGTRYTFKIPTVSSFNWINVTEFLSNTNTANPIATAVTGTRTYTVQATNAGCSVSAMTTVTVDPLTCSAATFSSTRCAGSNFTVTANRSGGGAPFNYVWSDGSATVYPNAATIIANLPSGSYNFTCLISDACGGSCNSDVTVVVNALPSIAITPSPANALICGTGSVSMLASGGTGYVWTPTTFLTPSNGLSSTEVSAATSTTAYTVTGTDANGCVNTAVQTVTVGPEVTMGAITATPASICSGSISALASISSIPQTISNYTLSNLTGQTYAPLSGGGITIINTSAQLTPGFADATQDDGGVLITLPFTFNYMGNAFTQMSMCTNGWVSAGNSSVITGAQSRNPGSFFTTTIPNNTIAPWFKDMGANFPVGPGSMRHGLIGTDVYAFQWDKAVGSSFSDGSAILVSFQVNIYGPTSINPGRIEMIYGPTVGVIELVAAIGIENATGGTNNYINAITGNGFTTTQSSTWPGNGNGFRFAAPSPLTYGWTPALSVVNSTSNNTNTVALNSTTLYTVTATSAPSGCSASSSVTVTVNSTPSAPLITATESTCQSGCTLSGGSFNVTTACGAGTTLTYYSDNTGSNPTTTAPVYNQTTPMTIYYACVDDITDCRSAIQTLTTVPGTCTNPSSSTITATESTCQSGCTVSGGSFNITACTGSTMTFYDDMVGTNPTTTAPTYNQTTPMTIYYACVDDITGCRSAMQTLTTVPGTCTDPSSSTITAIESTCQSGCTVSGGSFNITACTGSTMTFYDDMVGTNPTTTAPIYNQTTPMTIYYACVNTTTGCRSAIQTLTTVQGTCATPATPGTPTSNSPQCANLGVTITANGSAPSGETWYWQGTNANGTSTASNATSPYNAATSGTYYIRAQNNATLCWSASASIAVTVIPLPTITLGNNPAVCRGSLTANLTYSATTGSPNKYSIDFDAIAEGQGFIDYVDDSIDPFQIVLDVPIGATEGTYHATLTVKNTTTGCVSVLQNISVTILPLPFISLGPNPAVCFGSTSANLTYTDPTNNPDRYSIDYNATAEGQGFTDIVNAILPASPIAVVVPVAAAAGAYDGTITVFNTTTGCSGATQNFRIKVVANNTVGAASSSPSQCINTALSSITHATTGASGIANDGVPGTNGLPAGVTATWLDDVITISGTPTASGTFNYSILLTGGCGAISATGTIVVTATTSITASAGSNGSISPGGVTLVNCGNNSTVYTITPNTCYQISDVLVNGISVGPVSTYTFTNVYTDQTIEATFSLSNKTITASAGLGGSISPTGITTVICGNNSTIYTITADACYSIADVLVNGVSVGAVSTYTFTNITANQTIAAVFVLNTNTINASAGTGGSISPAGLTMVNCGINSTVYTITPNACYSIADVLVNGVSVGAVSTYTFTNITANQTIAASFSLNGPYTITATAGSNGSITPAGISTINCGANQAYTITPDAGYHILDVLVNGISNPAAISSGTYTFTNVMANNTIHAAFEADVTTIISGTIVWEQDDVSGVKDATVNITGAGMGSQLTDVAGVYSVTIPVGGNFTITPVKNINLLNGVTAADAMAIQRHITNIVSITDPYKLVAGDVNKSNGVTTVDASLITQSIMGNPAALAKFNASWRFVPSAHTMAMPPWGFPENITLTGASNAQLNKDFVGMKIGDVDGSGNPANRAIPKLSLITDDKELKMGETITVPFRVEQFTDLGAYQMAINFNTDHLEFVQVSGLDLSPFSTENFGTFNVSNGEIRAVWAQANPTSIIDGTEVCTFTFKVKKNGTKLSDLIKIDETLIPAHIYNVSYETAGIDIIFNKSTSVGEIGNQKGMQLLQNKPNPFVEQTIIGFVLPHTTEATLTIYNSQGQVVTQRKAKYNSGYNEEIFILNDYSGMLYYELATSRGILKRSMIQLSN